MEGFSDISSDGQCAARRNYSDELRACVLQTRSRLCQIQDNQQEASKSIEKYNNTLNGGHSGSMTNLADMSEGLSDRENGVFHSLVRGAQVCISHCISAGAIPTHKTDRIRPNCNGI